MTSLLISRIIFSHLQIAQFYNGVVAHPNKQITTIVVWRLLCPISHAHDYSKVSCFLKLPLLKRRFLRPLKVKKKVSSALWFTKLSLWVHITLVMMLSLSKCLFVFWITIMFKSCFENWAGNLKKTKKRIIFVVVLLSNRSNWNVWLMDFALF